MNSFRIHEIRSGVELERLRPEWEELWESCPNASPFQHPLWLLAWWQHFGGDKKLQTVALREGEKLVGVLPLCIIQEERTQKIMPVGIGLSDYLDGLFAPGFEAVGAQSVFSFLSEQTSEWDGCEFQPLPDDSPLLNAPLPRGISNSIEPLDTLTSLELPSRTSGFRNLLSKHFLDRIKEAGARAEKLGPVRFDIATHKTFDDSMEHLLRFHRARWGPPSEVAERFHEQTASSFLSRNELRLYRLRIGERIASVLYGFVQRQRGYLYLSGFEPEMEKISPGVLLITHAIESLINEGAKSCEFLRGREAYKYRWGVIERTTYARKLQHHQEEPSGEGEAPAEPVRE